MLRWHEEISNAVVRNVRFLLWREEIPPRNWVSTLVFRLPGWSAEEVRALLSGGEVPYERLVELARALGVAEEELANADFLGSSSVNIVSENLNLLFAGLEHGGKKELAAELGVNPTTVSRWASGDARPTPQKLRDLARYFGLPENFDLGTDPAFLLPGPVAVRDRRQWIQERVAGLTMEEINELFPAFQRLLREP